MTRSRALPILLVLLPQTLWAQTEQRANLSERATVSQTVNRATITVEYYRPVARGRDPLFGGVVHWGEMWTPGANWATSLAIDRDITVNGLAVSKGKYSIWMIPAQAAPWTVILHRDARLWHTRRPRDGERELLRFQVQPETLPHMEALAWYFPTVEREATALRMHWGTTGVTLRIEAPGTRD